MRNKLVSGIVFGIWVIGIGFFVIGVVLGSVYSLDNKVLKYKQNKCLITDYTIGKLNVCETKTGYEDFYMAVWSSVVGNYTNSPGITTVNKTTVLLPSSRYGNRSMAEKDINDGPQIGTIVDCMCFSDTSTYPNLNDDNDIDCDVWKACLLGVDVVIHQQTQIRNSNKAGEVMFYIGISIEAVLVVFIAIIYCISINAE